mgnify:CR=1 FL=1
MKYDVVNECLVLEDPKDQLDFMMGLMLAEGLAIEEGSEPDFEEFHEELWCEEEEFMASEGGTNRETAMEFFPKAVSTEATTFVLEALDLNPGDFPDAEIEI